MRRSWILLLLFCVLLTASWAAAETDAEAQRIAGLKEFLVSWEGFAEDEVNRMMIETGGEGEAWEARAYAAECPAMVYTARLTGPADGTLFDTEAGETVWVESPLAGMPDQIMWNESTAREGLRLALQNG